MSHSHSHSHAHGQHHSHSHSHAPESGRDVDSTVPSDSSSDTFFRDALKLILCAAAIYGAFIYYGIIQEGIFKSTYGESKAKFRETLFLLFVQCVANSVFAFFYVMLTVKVPNTVPKIQYFKIAGSYIFAMMSSTTALQYMSYPAQVLAKASKMIPVMLMRIVQVNITYTIREIVQVFLVTGGIIAFMFFDEADSKKSQHGQTSLIGLALCILSLILDGYTSPSQERVYKDHQIPSSLMQLWMNIFASGIVFVLLLVTGQLWSGLEFFTQYPKLWTDSIMLGILNALGQAAILYTIQAFNALVTTTITTTRKLFTLLASVIVFGHSLVPLQWSGVVLVAIGLGMEVEEKYAKWREKNERKKAEKNKSETEKGGKQG